MLEHPAWFPLSTKNTKYKKTCLCTICRVAPCHKNTKYKNISCHIFKMDSWTHSMVSPCYKKYKHIFNMFSQGYKDTLQVFSCHKKWDMGTHCAVFGKENTKYKNIFVLFSQGYEDRLQGCSCHRKSPTLLLISTHFNTGRLSSPHFPNNFNFPVKVSLFM